MSVYRNTDEEVLFNRLKQLIKDSDDPLLKRQVETIFKDEHLMIVLRCKKMRTEGAFDTVKRMMVDISFKYQDVYRKFHPSLLQHVIKTKGLGPLRHRDHRGSHILTVDIKHWKTSSFSLEDFVLTCIMIGMEMAKKIETQENGMIIIANVESLSFSQARQVTPALVKKFVDIIYNSLPMRYKGIHFTGINALFHVPLSILKTFLPPKLKRRLHIHKNSESLFSHFSREILPTRLNGTLLDEQAYDFDIVNDLSSPHAVALYDRIKLVAERGR